MGHKSYIFAIILSFILLSWSQGTSIAQTAQTIVVSPSNAQGWLFDDPVYCTAATTPAAAPYDPCSVTGGGTPIVGQFELGTDTVAGSGFEVGPLMPPQGVGSYFAEITAGGSKVIAARTDYNLVSFTGLTNMSIATYLDPSQTDDSNWYINLYVDQNGDGTYDCRLDGVVPTQAANSWQTTDLYNLTWTGASGCAAFNGNLGAFTVANPNAQLINGFNAAGFPQIIINQGDTQATYEGYVGNFDAFRINHATVGDITWDFEPDILPPQTIVVSPSNAQGWLFDNPVYCTAATTPAAAPYDPCSVTGGGTPIVGQFELGTDAVAGAGFEVGPLMPPQGVGSYFAEITAGGSKVIAARTNYNLVSFAGLIGMSIATYLDPTQTDDSNWYINLYVDQDGNGTYDCRLDGVVPTQAANSWQTTDLYNLTWTGASGCAAFNGNLGAFAVANPNAQLINGFNAAGFPQIIINQGDTQANYEGYVGNFDAFLINHITAGNITWDFEPDINPVTITATIPTVLENAATSGQFTVDLGIVNPLATPLTVNYSVTGTATNGTDYTTISGSVDIPVGQQTATIDISPINDALIENSETVIVTLTSTNNASFTVSTTPAEVSITDDDVSPVVAVVDDNNDNQDTNQQPNIGVFDPALSKVGFLLPGDLGIIGERLEWVVTVNNTGAIAGTNVIFTDTLRDELQVTGVTTSQGTGSISGQTVTVNIGTVNPDDVINITIDTTVLESNITVDNTACVNSSDGRTHCITSNPVTTALIASLPSTGEQPWWRNGLLSIVLLAGLGLLGTVVIQKRNSR